MTTTIQNNQDLLAFLISQANTGQRNWFGFQQQKIVSIDLAYKIAANHADKMTPTEIAEYVFELNKAIYTKILKG